MNPLGWWRRLFARPQRIPPPPAHNGHAAAQARARAEEKLRDTIQQQPAVDEVTRVSRQLRAQDHFGEQIERALRRRAA